MTLLANADGGVDRIERYELACSKCRGAGSFPIPKGRDICPVCNGACVVIERREMPPPEEEEC